VGGGGPGGLCGAFSAPIYCEIPLGMLVYDGTLKNWKKIKKKTLTQNQTNVFLLTKFRQNTKNKIGERMVLYRHILVFCDFFFPNFGNFFYHFCTLNLVW
jgi:hypothetical protein